MLPTRPAYLALVIITATAHAALVRAAMSQDTPHPGDGGIVYGEGHAFMLDTPPGWILDNEAGVEDGLIPVFYPEGSDWATAPAIIYVRTTSRDTLEPGSLAEFVAEDSTDAVHDSPRLLVVAEPGIATHDGSPTVIRGFMGDRWGNIEVVAYIEERRVFVTLVLTARTDAAYRAARPAFEYLVKSYWFWTEDVTIQR